MSTYVVVTMIVTSMYKTTIIGNDSRIVYVYKGTYILVYAGMRSICMLLNVFILSIVLIEIQ